MTAFDLFLVEKEERLFRVFAGRSFTLPDGRVVSPAKEGWTDGEYRIDAVPAPEPDINDLRKAASIDTADFLIKIALPPFEIISEQEAVAAAKQGDIPADFVPILDQMDPAQRLAAEVKWARDDRVARLNPLLAFVAQHKFGEDADDVLDAIFEIG